MSRIGKKPIPVPAGVTVDLKGQTFVVKGPKGELSFTLPKGVSLSVEGSEITMARANESKVTRALHGTSRSLIANMIQGVTEGFSRDLEIQGVGFKAVLQGKDVVLNLGYSHEIRFPIPEGLTITVDSTGTNLNIKGCDKQAVGQAAARIRSFYKAEPYKGKGVRYKGEVVRRKAGKAAA